MVFKAIVAMSFSDGIIGDKEGNIPWKSKADMKFFQYVTTDSILIIGRKTFESMGRVLTTKNRHTIVITSETDPKVKYAAIIGGNDDLVSFAGSKEEARAIAINKSDNFQVAYVAGGAEIYKLFFDDVEEIYANSKSGFHVDDPSDYTICPFHLSQIDQNEYVYDSRIFHITPENSLLFRELVEDNFVAGVITLTKK